MKHRHNQPLQCIHQLARVLLYHQVSLDRPELVRVRLGQFGSALTLTDLLRPHEEICENC